MDTRLAAAGAVAALGMVLLVPTFNALNASYVQDVPPPPWMPTPPTPPDMTPPTNFKPPPDMTPPTNWQGEMPPVCPPPVIRRLNETDRDYEITTPSDGTVTWRRSLTFIAPNGTIGVGGYVNFSDWRADSVSASVTPPAGSGNAWTNTTRGSTGGLLAPSNPAVSFYFNSYDRLNQQAAKPGPYTVTLAAELPVSGRAHTEFAVVLACGGLIS